LSFDNPQQELKVLRRHVIDGCQALDFPVTFKYERNFGNTPDVRNIREGVSFEKLFSLTPHLDNPAAARTYMVRWALLQLLIGNSDAHGKNFSYFVGEAGIQPTPMYDLVSVNVYGEAVEQEMAMAYGDEFRRERHRVRARRFRAPHGHALAARAGDAAHGKCRPQDCARACARGVLHGRRA
jgi:serine/threonine-protein kinase HipA